MCGSLPCLVELGTSTPSDQYHFSCSALDQTEHVQKTSCFERLRNKYGHLKRLPDSVSLRTTILAHAIKTITIFTLWKLSKHYKLISIRKAKGCLPSNGWNRWWNYLSDGWIWKDVNFHRWPCSPKCLCLPTCWRAPKGGRRQIPMLLATMRTY